MGDHLHLVAEAASTEALAVGMKGLCVRLARGLNRLLGRSGSVFADRYHVRVMESPRELRHVLAYVMNNARRHGLFVGRGRADEFSSFEAFDGWHTTPRNPSPPDGLRVVAPPRSWLRRVGWRRHGLIRLDEKPKGLGPRT
jgi:hypothetical protein